MEVTATGDPLAADDLSGWARRIALVLRRSGRPLVVLQAAVLLPAGAAAAGLSRLGWAGGTVAGLLAAAALSLAQAGSVDLAVREAAGRPTAVSAALAAGARRTPALLGWSALLAVLTLLGLAVAVLPGLYAAVVGAAALPGAVVVERAGLRRAATLVNRRLGGTVLRCAAGLFAAAGYGALVGALVAALHPSAARRSPAYVTVPKAATRTENGSTARARTTSAGPAGRTATSAPASAP